MAIAGIPDVGAIVSSLANPYGTPSQGEWNLVRGAFTTSQSNKTVVFFIETKKGQLPGQLTTIDQIEDGGGRRLAIYEYPYVDGQSVDDLGRKGEKFTFNIKFLGLNYQELLKQFIDVCLNSNETGTLSHPIRGNIPARFSDWDFVHRYDEWNSVTIKATFVEDNTGKIQSTNLDPASPNSALRTALQTLTNLSAGISSAITTTTALLGLPAAIKAGMANRLSSITGQVSRLLGQLAATFSTDAQTQALFANAQAVGGVTNVNSGTTSSGALPPVYQVGFSAADQANALAQQSAFISSNQLTTQAAVFAANQARAAIAVAIAEAQTNLGNDGFDIMLQYRQLAIQIQQVTQSSISAALDSVTIYRVPSPMSLRMVAFNNGLAPDRQNDIESLNPYLPSVNLIAPGTMLVVPSS